MPAEAVEPFGAKARLVRPETEVVLDVEFGSGSERGRVEADRYQWAVQNTGTDPFELQKQAQAAQQQQAQSSQQATAQQMDNFKKAFSVCLEAKHYMVK
jgi:hypothetical protein